MSTAETILRELVELHDEARDSEELSKMKRGPELLRRLQQMKEMLLRVVHDAARNEKDQHVSAALNVLREDVGQTRELITKIEQTKLFNNSRNGKAVELRIRDLISDGMSLSTALAMVTVATGQQTAIDLVMKKIKEKEQQQQQKQSAAAATTTPESVPEQPPTESPQPSSKQSKEGEEEKTLERLTELCQEGNRFLLGNATTQIDLGQAFSCFLLAAQGGYAPAQLQCGAMCEFGLGTAVDQRAAMEWYNLAASQDLPEALLAVGRAMISQQQDLEEACHFLERAAEQGNSEAMLTLGQQLGTIQGKETESFNWLEKSAKAGNMVACCKLGEVYLTGIGVEKDLGNAFECFVKSASQGYAPAIVLLGSMYERGDWVDESFVRANELYLRAVQSGYRDALLPLARTLLKKGEVDQAKQILEDLENSPEALVLLGDLHEQGLIDGNPKLEVAFHLYEKAAKMSHPHAITKMANYVFSGAAGVKQDEEEAVHLYTLAAELGDPQAQAELGTLYLEGSLLPQSLELSVKWLKLAADKDNSMALFSLGELYSEGRGVEKDPSKAAACFARASELGHPLTQQR